MMTSCHTLISLPFSASLGEIGNNEHRTSARDPFVRIVGAGEECLVVLNYPTDLFLKSMFGNGYCWAAKSDCSQPKTIKYTPSNDPRDKIVVPDVVKSLTNPVDLTGRRKPKPERKPEPVRCHYFEE